LDRFVLGSSFAGEMAEVLLFIIIAECGNIDERGNNMGRLVSQKFLFFPVRPVYFIAVIIIDHEQ